MSRFECVSPQDGFLPNVQYVFKLMLFNLPETPLDLSSMRWSKTKPDGVTVRQSPSLTGGRSLRQVVESWRRFSIDSCVRLVLDQLLSPLGLPAIAPCRAACHGGTEARLGAGASRLSRDVQEQRTTPTGNLYVLGQDAATTLGLSCCQAMGPSCLTHFVHSSWCMSLSAVPLHLDANIASDCPIILFFLAAVEFKRKSFGLKKKWFRMRKPWRWVYVEKEEIIVFLAHIHLFWSTLNTLQVRFLSWFNTYQRGKFSKSCSLSPPLFLRTTKF